MRLKTVIYPLLLVLYLLNFIFTVNLIAQDDFTNEKINIKINPLVELNNKTKKEIYALRKAYVLEYPGLIKTGYSPSDAVFGQIEDKKPWWGILGYSYYGSGLQSILGPAEESRFIANPYLLVGLDAGHALSIKGSSLSPIPIFPEPQTLTLNKNFQQGSVVYNISSFWQKQRQYGDPTADKQELRLIAYNARDFGFNYIHIDLSQSKNILPTDVTNKIITIRYFLHCGGSCGYPGGCNNASPDQKDLSIKLKTVPAAAFIKLWRLRPDNPDSKADMVFIIEMI